jgi:hypothetical protein
MNARMTTKRTRGGLLGDHPPIGVGCMLTVLTMWAITLSAIAYALAWALFSWRLG